MKRDTLKFTPLVLGLLTLGVVVALDQVSKWYILKVVMAPPRILPITPFFNLVLTWNTGVSFSLFNSYGITGTYILIGLTIAISLYFLWWLFRAESLLLGFGLGGILGGAFGNLIDRLQFGAVVDFLHFYYGSFSWPAFNIADTFITIGVGFIVIESFLTHKGEKLV